MSERFQEHKIVLAGVITLGLTWMTVSSQAVRAASANPVDTLRYE